MQARHGIRRMRTPVALTNDNLTISRNSGSGDAGVRPVASTTTQPVWRHGLLMPTSNAKRYWEQLSWGRKLLTYWNRIMGLNLDRQHWIDRSKLDATYVCTWTRLNGGNWNGNSAADPAMPSAKGIQPSWACQP